MDDTKRDITNLAGIYGAVDRQLELESGPEGAGGHPVTLLLPVYRDPGAFWFELYLKQAESVDAWDVDPLGDPLELAQHALERLSESNAHCRNRARRLFAVGVAARTFPRLDPELLAAAAFGRRTVEAFGGRDVQPEVLADYLRRTPQERDPEAALDSWWYDVLFTSGAVPEPEGHGPRPCTARLTHVRVGGRDRLVPTFQTEQDADIWFDDAVNFLDPETWTCFPAWCKMDPLGDANGARRYQEVVSFDCIGKTTPVLTVNLDFESAVEDGPLRRGGAEYRLSPDQPEHKVFVNQGWLEVEELSRDYPLVRVSTSKSLELSPQYGGPGLIIFLCHIGYLSMLEDLFCCASKAPGEEGYPDVPYPGRKPPQAAEHTTGAARPSHGRARGVAPGYGGLIKVMMDETADAVEECIDEFADTANTAYRRIDEKSYRADHLVQDIADNWARMLGKGARVANASLRVVQSAPGVVGESASGVDGEPAFASEDEPATPRKARGANRAAQQRPIDL